MNDQVNARETTNMKRDNLEEKINQLSKNRRQEKEIEILRNKALEESRLNKYRLRKHRQYSINKSANLKAKELNQNNLLDSELVSERVSETEQSNMIYILVQVLQ